MKDGVTLIADAIRKENEEKLKSQIVTGNNVIDVTAQFKNGGKSAETKTVEVSNKTDTSKESDDHTEDSTETDTDADADGTLYRE